MFHCGEDDAADAQLCGNRFKAEPARFTRGAESLPYPRRGALQRVIAGCHRSRPPPAEGILRRGSPFVRLIHRMLRCNLRPRADQ